MVRLLARVIGVGIETADMLVQEVLSGNFETDGRGALCRSHGSPDESGKRRREKGLAKAGNARCGRGLIQLAWRFFTVPKGQRTGAMVSGADRKAEGRAQDDDDRGTRSETADRAVALGHDRRNPGRRCVAGGGLSAVGWSSNANA